MSREVFDPGLLIVVSGPSGSGKSTLCKLLLEEESFRFGLVISHTSRPPRHTEENAKDYYFLSREEFETNIANGIYLEHALVHGNYYGTPKDQVESLIAKGLDVLLEIDVQGGLHVREVCDDSILIFVSTPDYEDLKTRLEGRKTDRPDVIELRLKNALKEMSSMSRYDYLLINQNLPESLQSLKKILDVEKKRIKRLQIKKVFAKMRIPDF